MVTCLERSDAQGVEFVLQPNRSLNWKAAQAAFFVICGFSAAIAGYFASLGAWLVLPFAGLEVLAMGLGLYLCALGTHRREILRIDAQHIVIQRGLHGPRHETRLPRAWARVVLASDARNWYPNRLLLRSHGRDTEVGKQLLDDERRQLAAALGHYLMPGQRRPTPVSQVFPLLETKGRLPADPAAG